MKPIKQYAYLFDATRCIDCRACMIACTVENQVPMNDSYIWVAGKDVIGEYPNLKRATMPYHCMHCLEPSCASACIVGAWQKRDDGPVVYDDTKCIGCRYCMNACPFDVPHFEWEKGIAGGALITKCQMCKQRLEVGQEPACVQTCPTGALTFGERQELIAEAHKRINAHSTRYINHVYGETENGGTSYLILSHVPFKELGLPEIAPTPVTTVSETVMSGTLPFAFTWGAVLAGAALLIRLRNRGKEIAAAQDAETEKSTEEIK
jgi:formate dehydrogenase iron-sulfur subunit